MTKMNTIRWMLASLILAGVCGVAFADKRKVPVDADPALSGHPGFQLAIQELNLACEEAGLGCEFASASRGENGQAKIGGPSLILRLIESPAKGPAEWNAWTGDGYRIRPERGSIRIDSTRVRGLLYGMFYVARQIVLRSELPWTLNIDRQPAFPFRMASDSPEAALRLGYNMIPLGSRPAELCLLDEIEPPLFSGEARTAIQRRREDYTQRLERAKTLELEAVASGDEFELPMAVLRDDLREKIVCKGFSKEDLALGMGIGRVFCFAKPELWKLIDLKYRDLFETFPSLAGAMVRLGENRSQETGVDLVGCGVYAYSRAKYCEECQAYGYDDRISGTIRHLYSSIVDENHRLYIHRTWDISDRLFHSNPEVFHRLTMRLPADSRLILSTKYTATDFWRYNPLNPTFDVPTAQPRMVEVQCTREYEGKGAYPAYIGSEVQSALQTLAGRGVKGIWSWHHGGGQGGPTVQMDVWNQAHAYLVSELAWNPLRKAEEIALEWAALTVGRKAAGPLAELLMLSEDTARALHYFEAYSSRHPGWTPANNWLRDDKIRGSRNLSPIYFECRDRIEDMIEEKDGAIKNIERQLDLLEQARNKCPKERLRVFCTEAFSSRIPAGSSPVASGGLQENWIATGDFFDAMKSSLQYELQLARVLRNYVAAYFQGRRWIDTGAKKDRRRAEDALKAWKTEWGKYNKDTAALPFVPSLYRDDGMVAAIDFIARALEQGPDPVFQWWTIGPFSNNCKEGFKRAYPPEESVNLRGQYAGVEGPVEWKVFDSSLIYDGFFDLDAFYEINDWVVAYAWTSFYSGQGGDALLHLGSDDGLVAWFNGARIAEADEYRDARPDQHVIPVRLRAGKNEILLKITEGILGWGFYFRLTDPEGKTFQDAQAIMLGGY